VNQSALSLRERADRYGAAIRSFLQQDGPVFLLTEMKGNIGDRLIQRGTERLLDSHAVPYDRLSVAAVARTPHRLVGATLAVPGSGAWTTRWHQWLPDLVLLASAHADRVVVLPSSFDIAVPVVGRALSQPNVYPICREPRSFRQLRTRGRAALALDPALYAFDFRTPGASSGADRFGRRTLVALRTDRGSGLQAHGWSIVDGVNDDISVTASDLDSFLAAISGSARVVTDRLHVAVAGVMLGKHVDYLDPYDLKISTYARFAFRDEFDDRLVQRDERWLEKQAIVQSAGGA